jgi:hypothetical protein
MSNNPSRKIEGPKVASHIDPSRDPNAHYTCTSSSSLGVNKNNEYAVITDEMLLDEFGHVPPQGAQRIIYCERFVRRRG